MRKIDCIVVHCSATPVSADVGVQEIRDWHTQRGFFDIGYHYVITRDGVLREGRPLEKAGAHAKGHNTSSIGVCLVGGVDSNNKPEANFSAVQYSTLESVLLHFMELYNIPSDRVLGHNEVSSKDCPCFNVRGFVQGIGG